MPVKKPTDEEALNEDVKNKKASEEETPSKGDGQEEQVQEKVTPFLPRLVYRTPGYHQAPGTTYDYKRVSSAEEMEAALEEGWFKTLPEALADVRK